jgi:hypothetical protein
MPGESPLSMMRTPDRPLPRRTGGRGQGRWIAGGAIIVALAVIWTCLWYYAAAIVEQTLTGWYQREAAAGRVYSCGSQSVGGFPFMLAVHCYGVAADVKSTQPAFSVAAQTAIVGAMIWHPTSLVGDVVGPLTFADLGQSPRVTADWTHGQITVRGIPPNPESASFSFDAPHVDRVMAAAGPDELFKADQIEAAARVIGGEPNRRPVIEATLHVGGALAPTLHPLLATPADINLDAVVRGFEDLSPKSWPERVREMQAAGGGIDIKELRMAEGDATIIVATGTLTLNDHGKLDGILGVAVVGIERIIPMLGLDRLIAQGVDRLSGSDNFLDRLAPGISGVIRQSANAGAIETLKKMGQPTSIDGRPAIALPLRFVDGTIYLGVLPVGQIAPLF